ncbi:MAG: outer rane chaperone Skp (OmpH) [Bryobacterales bacterium]|nr:outer rane chaperone Skp (OmpH) [Bryobacterales bacterium]
MKSKFAILPLLGVGAVLLASGLSAQTPASAAPAPATPSAPAVVPSKVGVINIQEALINTKDGQKAAGELKTKFAPKQSEIEKKQADISGLQQQLSKGANTMSEDAKQKIMRDIDQKNVLLKRDTEDATADLEQEQQRIMGDLGAKMISVLNKYATENGYALVIDISSQQTPVLFASNTIDITREIIVLYDKAPPQAAPPSASRPPAARPATPPAVPKK